MTATREGLKRPLVMHEDVTVRHVSRYGSVIVGVTITDSGYIRPRRRFGWPRSATVVLGWCADDQRPIRRLWWRYSIVAEFRIGGLIRANVLGTTWTRRRARRAVGAIRNGGMPMLPIKTPRHG